MSFRSSSAVAATLGAAEPSLNGWVSSQGTGGVWERPEVGILGTAVSQLSLPSAVIHAAFALAACSTTASLAGAEYLTNFGAGLQAQSVSVGVPQGAHLPHDMSAPSAVGATGNLGRLMAVLEEVPIDDGVIHPGESMAQELLQELGSENFGNSVAKAVQANSPNAAGLLVLAGRMTGLKQPTRRELMSAGLLSSSTQVRDAAVLAFERWNDPGLLPVLAAHREPVPWLADYIRAVSADVSR